VNFRVFIVNSSDVTSLRAYLEENGLTNNDTYWTCVGSALDEVEPPAPANYSVQFQRLNYQISVQQCDAMVT